MTGNEHLQEEAFRRGVRGRITVAEARHLETCGECTAHARENYYDEGLPNFIAALYYEPSEEDPTPSEASRPARDEAAPGPWLWALTSAASMICIAALVGGIALYRSTEAPADVPRPVEYAHGSPRWDAAVSEALRRGRVDPVSPFAPQTATITPAYFDEGRKRHPLTPRFAAFLESQAALRLRPADHLLLGILDARANLREDATRELTEHLRTHPNDAFARRILDSLPAAGGGSEGGLCFCSHLRRPHKPGQDES
jgi:hypothetical protein